MPLKKLANPLIKPYIGFSKTTWKLIIAGFVNSTGLIISIYISLYLNSLQYSTNQIALTIALLGLGGLLGGYFGGALIDKFSSISVCKTSLLFSALCLLVFPLDQQLLFLDIMAFLLGLANALFRPAFMVALMEGEHLMPMDSIIALRRVAINLGMGLGAFIFGLLTTFGYSILFWVSMTSNLIAYIMLVGIKKLASTKEPNESHTVNVSFEKIHLIKILLLMFLTLLVFNQFQTVYPLYLKNDLMLDVHKISFLFGLSAIFIALFQMPITAVLSRMNTNLNCALGTLLICSGFAVLPFLHDLYILIIASCLLWTIGEIIFFPAILKLILQLSNKKKGQIMGIYQFLLSLSALAAPPAGALLYTFNKNLIWGVCGIIGLITCIAFLAMHHRNK